MDGAPVRGDRIPIRVPLSGVSLTPSALNVANGMLSVRYFLSLVSCRARAKRIAHCDAQTLPPPGARAKRIAHWLKLCRPRPPSQPQVLVDEEDRRYFKQAEVLLWRDVVG